MLLNTSILNAAAMINMGECFTLTVNGVDVQMEGVFNEPYANARLGNMDVEQANPAMEVKTADLALLGSLPVDNGNSSITREGGSAQTIFKIKPGESGMTRLEVRSY